MQSTFFFVGKRRYGISFEKIEREKDLFIYWGSIHLSKAIEFSCMRMDDQPIFITTPLTLPEHIESAVLDAIEQVEKEIEKTTTVSHLNIAC